MKNKVLIILICLLVLVGCTKPKDVDKDEDVVISRVDSSSYAVVAPFKSSTLRDHHYIGDFLGIGNGMIEYSKGQFSVDKYALKEGTILQEAGADLLALINRQSTTNPNGLNPTRETEFETGNGVVVGPAIINDLFEINFVYPSDTSKIEGITLGLSVSSNIDDNKGGTIAIADEVLYQFATNAGRKLESYFRNLPGLSDVPIYILIFDAYRQDSGLGGKFIAEGYFQARSGQFSKLEEKWVFIPTTESSNIDMTLHSQFVNMKKAIENIIPDNIGVVGRGKFVNGVISYLKIDVSIMPKTYTEVYALIQYFDDYLTNTEIDADVYVEIKNFSTTLAILSKDRGSSSIDKVILD